MPPHRLVLKKETRMLGAVQVMMGLINGALGRIWLLFYTRQFGEISTEYKPAALLSGYPSWMFLFFIISGVLTIETEKKRSPNLKTAVNLSVCLWMSSIMDLIIARKVVEWGNEAFYRHRYVLRP
ncbi:hypothetical protein R6Z07F_014500 [Ovis aries]